MYVQSNISERRQLFLYPFKSYVPSNLFVFYLIKASVYDRMDIKIGQNWP